MGVYNGLRRALFLVPPARIHGWVFAGQRTATGPAPVRRRLRRRLS
ncbi:MAG: dihydroorotate dehydrogenase (quinone), partial [Mycobacterium sp.]